MTEADIGMTEHGSKNALGRSVPIKTKTDVEEDGTSEDGSPRPVCIYALLISTSLNKKNADLRPSSTSISVI